MKLKSFFFKIGLIVVFATIGSFAIIFLKKTEPRNSKKSPVIVFEKTSKKEIQIPTKSNVTKDDNELDDMLLSEEEIEARPSGISEENWRGTVFFHRQNTKEQNAPIRFYGKVSDQNGSPVRGARVSASVSYYVESLSEQIDYGGGKSGTEKIDEITDGKGLFLIEGYRARSLRIHSIEKEGYRSMEKLQTGFIFGVAHSTRHTPNPSEPVIFPM